MVVWCNWWCITAPASIHGAMNNVSLFVMETTGIGPQTRCTATGSIAMTQTSSKYIETAVCVKVSFSSGSFCRWSCAWKTRPKSINQHHAANNGSRKISLWVIRICTVWIHICTGQGATLVKPSIFQKYCNMCNAHHVHACSAPESSYNCSRLWLWSSFAASQSTCAPI